MLVGSCLLPASRAESLQFEDAVAASRDYLQSNDNDERAELRKRLSTYQGPIEPVLTRLRERTYNRVEPGYHYEKSFSIPAPRDKHPDDLLYFNVPPSYSPKKATGLIVFMHGGGATEFATRTAGVPELSR